MGDPQGKKVVRFPSLDRRGQYAELKRVELGQVSEVATSFAVNSVNLS